MKIMLGTVAIAAIATAGWAMATDTSGPQIRTKSNPGSEGAAAPPAGDTVCGAEQDCTNTLMLVTDGDTDRAISISRVDFAPAAAAAFSACSTACPDDTAARRADVGTVRGSGSATVHFDNDGSGAPSAHLTVHGFCPAEGARGTSPIKGIGVVIRHGRGQGDEFRLSNAIVTGCAGDTATISYSDMAINEKGLPGTPTPKGTTHK